jgi:CheY-like chemotaxis protein
MSKRLPILVADDDEHDVFLLRRAFTKAGFSHLILDVHDGEEAIKYLVGTNGFEDRNRYPVPALLLLDIKMPKANGFDVLKWLQTRPELKDMKVIMLSSSSEDSDVQEARKLGANDYFIKAQFEDLQQVVKTIATRWLPNAAET